MTKLGTFRVAGTTMAALGDVVVGTITGSVLGAGSVTIGSKSASYVE